MQRDRTKLVKQGYAYLSGFEHLGIFADLKEREELADIALHENVAMHEAVEIFLERRGIKTGKS